ncbi:MAG TPA: UvrD-helicase domain-containing protein [Acidimicrobiales bacterium]|nr:UvrD-helicase domain-containing protein [Acidimicrobiales bacterium]
MTILAFPTAGTPPEPEPFELTGPLPRAMTLLEASAGTGKTFTIAALTARYIAEAKNPIDKLLVITFTRMATGELRERVRDRLVSAHDGLSAVIDGGAPPASDQIVNLLADVADAERKARRDRLAKAIADFDAATIETTHGFCLQVLYGLGTAGDVDRDVTLVEDVRDLMEEVVDDLYLRKFAHRGIDPDFSRKDALEIAQKVLDHPAAPLFPPWSDGQDPSAVRRRFAQAVEEELDRRKRAQKILTYDDVLIRLRDTLRDPERGAQARFVLRSRYDVVLVDEFQDTDPVQWEIMHEAFGGRGSTLVLIGDPKQAIYAFRGADVDAYLKASRVVEERWTLDENWRSDERLLRAYDALFANARLGHPEIAYRHIKAAPPNVSPRLVGAPVDKPLRVRIAHAADGLVETGAQGLLVTGDAREVIAADLAAQTVELLEAKPTLVTRHRDGTEAGEERLHAGHIAVLVRSNKEAFIVRDALHDAGVPAVIGGAGSVFLADSAREWLRLLEALERPTSRERASLVALTQFVGWPAGQVAEAGEEEWEHLHWDLHRWASLLRDKGVATLYETVCGERGVPARVLARQDGDRFMTDLRHVAQLLHEAGVSEGVGATAMANWLGRRINEADRAVESEDRTRRLESDSEAVQVITIHRSKGLEFPVVLCPYAWDGYIHPIDVPVYHDPDNSDERTVDVGSSAAELKVHKQWEEAEGQGEDLRLLYVALTRACHQAVLWWASAWYTYNSPLSRLLFDRDAQGNVRPKGGKKARRDADVEAAFAALGPEVSVERVTRASGARWQGDRLERSGLEAARFDRTLDAGWRRLSYSSITSLTHEAQAIGSEPEHPLIGDEDSAPPAWSADAVALGGQVRDVPLLLASMPGGTLVGTVVHSVMERTDFSAADLEDEVRRSLAEEVAWRNVDLGDAGAVVAGLCTAIELPLGPEVADVRLRDVARRDRLDEMGFELPLVGGDRPTGDLQVSDLATLLDDHLGPEDPVRPYTARLRAATLTRELRGYLNGSLDLVFRLADGRYVLADYKTNRLAPPDEMLTAWHYRPEAVQAEMLDAHYPLQALLYTVALHRYLRWRQPGYAPERHLGGVLYLFVRGMSALQPVGAGDRPCGVWSWSPPPGLVEALSDLFDEGARP